jgi:DMSO reductase anchor subunit
MGDRERIHREHFAAGAIYGTVVYLTILVLLEEDRTDAEDAVAILVGTALVFWLAHVYAHLVPRIAAEGRLRTGRFL